MSCLDPKDMPPDESDMDTLFPPKKVLLAPMDRAGVALSPEDKEHPIILVVERDDLDVHPSVLLSISDAMALIINLRKAIRMAECLPVTPVEYE